MPLWYMRGSRSLQYEVPKLTADGVGHTFGMARELAEERLRIVFDRGDR